MKKMKKLNSLFLALFLVLAMNGVSYGWGTNGGDGSDFRQLQETAVFFNNSGTTMSVGDVVILDLGGTGVTAGTTLGAYVDKSTATDDVLVVGVVKSVLAADQGPVVVVTKGPIDTLCSDSTDAVASGASVGTKDVGAHQSGLCGAGSNLGIALEAGDGTDSGNIFIWIDPTGAD